MSDTTKDTVQAPEGGGPHNTHCLNCGTALNGAFCHVCGQKDLAKRQTLGELWVNFISSFWSYEGKFFQTTKYLITRPGFLAREYNDGRRERFFHPARMYVFISFVFFLLVVSLPDKEDTSNVTKDMTEDEKKEYLDSTLMIGLGDRDSSSQMIRKMVLDSVKRKKGKANINLGKADYETLEEYDSVQQLKPEAERDGWIVRAITIRAIELNLKYKGRGEEFGKDIIQAFKDNFSRILFFLLPIFALLLKLLYWRRDFYYSEHLVFSIYYYNFFYLGGSVALILGHFGWDIPTSLVQWWIFLYLLFAMKRMYQQGWGKTVLKFGFFTFAFALSMVFAMIFAGFVFLLNL